MGLNDLAINGSGPQAQAVFTQEDLAELGATLATAGWTTLEARQLITLMQQAGAQVALNMAPVILEQVRQINQARIMTMMTMVRTLPNNFGYVSRDRVLDIIQRVFSTPPRN